MDEKMKPFRDVDVDGPPWTPSKRLWSAKLDLGAAKLGTDPLFGNFSIRLLVQAADTTTAYVEDDRLQWYPPLLLAAAVTPRALEGGAGRATLLGTSFEARTVPRLPGEALYEDVRVTPAGPWPPRLRPDSDPTNGALEPRWVRDEGKYEVTAPPLRVTEGRVRVAYEPGNDLDFLLKLAPAPGQPNRRLVFGCVEMTLAALENGGNGLVFDLTPEGVEFDARIPDPFDPSAAMAWVAVRLRLSRVAIENGSDLELRLVGGADAGRLAAGLAVLGGRISAGDSPIVLHFREDLVPPLSWPLTPSGNGYVCGAPGEIPRVALGVDATIARVVTLPDPAGGATTVARLQRPAFSVAGRKPGKPVVATIRTLPPADPQPLTGPTLTVDWSARSRAPDKLNLTADRGWAQTGDMLADLAGSWQASGALGVGEPAPCAFIALQRGWVQAPTWSKPILARDLGGQTSAMEGVLRFDLAPEGGAATLTDRLTRAGLEVVGAEKIEATITLDGEATTYKVEVRGANGVLDGALWYGRASPTPTDVLPPLDAGPAALGSLPVGFGGNAAETGWAVSWPEFQAKGPAQLTLVLDKFCGPDAPLWVWRPHPELALVSAIAATRTAESATRPSATRELFPAEVTVSAETRKVTFAFSDDEPLPTSVSATMRTSGDRSWSWPWPAATAPGPLSASPVEAAAISMVSLTLPGVEFSPAPSAQHPTDELLASLRYDLPLLDELHANARPPRPAAGASVNEPDAPRRVARPPTALDTARLSEDWREKSRRLAKARTSADRVVFVGDETLADVTLWHRFDVDLKTGKVPGLVDTWKWSPPHFKVSARSSQNGLKLGAYLLGDSAKWFAGADALGGLSADFVGDPVARTLTLATPGASGLTVRVEGFAASSFDSADGSRLNDPRGLSLDKATQDLAGATLRSFENHALEKAPKAARQLTLKSPANLDVGGHPIRFWCRDLPVTPLGTGSTFDARGGLEHDVGPNPEALSPDRLPHAHYEWRLFAAGASDLPEFELPLLAPFAFRPLRLTAATFDSGGRLTSLHVVGSVQVDSKPATTDDGPFGENRADATGNLVRLEFGAGLQLSAIQRVAYDEAKREFQVLEGDTAAVEFLREVRSKDKTKRDPIPATIALWLGVTGGAPTVTAARLRARLFGRRCILKGKATVATDATTLEFNGLAASKTLTLGALWLTWKAGEQPELDLAAAIVAAPALKKVSAFVRPFTDKTMFWLGCPAEIVAETVDHATGAMVMDVGGGVAEGSRLFRGFILPDGRLKGIVAIAFVADPEDDWSKAEQNLTWPEASAILAELAFEADDTDGSKRVTRLRHTYRQAASDGGDVINALTIDATFREDSESAVRWPAGFVQLDMSPFASLPQNKDSWKRTLRLDGPGPDFVHLVRPRLARHIFPLASLEGAGVVEGAVDANAIRLVEPWRFRAVTDHALRPGTDQDWDGQAIAGQAPGALAWTSVDEVCLWDMRELKSEAAYAFMPRFRNSNPQIKVAGVVRRTLAGMGLPTHALLEAIRNDPPKGPGPGETALVLSGATVIDTVTDPKAGRGLTLTPQWLMPWAAESADALPDALGPLRRIPQRGAIPSLDIAAYDAAAGAPRVLSGPPAVSFGARDGDEATLEAGLSRVLGQAPKARRIGDQSVSDRDPPDTLKEPLFIRTLVAMTALVRLPKLREPRVFPLATSCVVPNVWEKDTATRRPPEVRLVVTAWGLDATPNPPVAEPAIDLIVVDEDKVLARRLPAALAASLAGADGGIEADGRARRDAALRALGLAARPRVVILARVASDHTDPASAELATPHSTWLSLGPPIAREVQPPELQADSERDTLYASAALGWPTDLGVARAAGAHARLGEERAVRNAGLAWAGRQRSIAWPAIGLPGPTLAADSLRDGLYMTMGHRTDLRRRATDSFRAPPDRHFVIAPPRSRAPVVEALQSAFKAQTGGVTPVLAAISPGAVEVTVTATRPGVRYTQTDGLVVTADVKPFDPAEPGSGRAATRGSLIVRGLRGPLSSGFTMGEEDLRRRRATFVASDEKDSRGLKPLKAIAGPAQVFRDYGKPDEAPPPTAETGPRPPPTTLPETPWALTLAMDYPAQGWLTSSWDGRVRLKATAASGTAKERLANLTFLPSGEAKPLAELRVGAYTLTFERMTWSASADGAMILDFAVSESSRQRTLEDVRAALDAANADTQIQFTLRGREALKNAPTPADTGDVALPTASAILVKGPPRVATFSLGHIPTRRRWLPRPACTLVFADPAYDQELGSPANTRSATLGEDVYMLGTDRTEYDLSATLHFAVWRHLPPPGPPPTSAWDLRIAVTSPEGGLQPLRLGEAPPKPNGAYAIEGEAAYAIPLAALRDEKGKAAAKLKAGDRLVLSVQRTDGDSDAVGMDKAIQIDVGVIDAAVLPPPSAVYGVAEIRGADNLGAPLFATAPLPVLIEFPDLIGDLRTGHVRRRGLFVWAYTPGRMPKAGAAHLALVKNDRTGGGQQPSSVTDFGPVEGLRP